MYEFTVERAPTLILPLSEALYGSAQPPIRAKQPEHPSPSPWLLLRFPRSHAMADRAANFAQSKRSDVSEVTCCSDPGCSMLQDIAGVIRAPAVTIL